MKANEQSKLPLPVLYQFPDGNSGVYKIEYVSSNRAIAPTKQEHETTESIYAYTKANVIARDATIQNST